jgi:ATP-binding cassette, subfamily F, member 3
MSLLTASDLAKSFGASDIFSSVSLQIPRRARIGLVGVNGIGKTTLLKILLGEEEPTQGKVHRAQGLHIGYLPQESMQTSALTLWQECQQPFAQLQGMQSELADLAEKMSASPQDGAMLAKYGSLQSRFEHHGGYEYETRMRQVLSGLGFSPADYERPLVQFSGGERTRAVLARLLLDAPDLLLLDEPTNHLDIQAIEWLEDFLKGFPGGVLLVSHDRYFLDHVADQIWEMTPAIETYRGNYTAYLRQREERYQRRLEEFNAQQEFITREEEYIRRNMAGQNTRQAKGRLKRLERLLSDARLTPPARNRQFKFKITSSARSGELVLRTFNLKVGYQDDHEVLFRVPDLVLQRGECAAIIGPNGAGKTTFLKTILAQIPPLAGESLLGASLQVGYFSQAHDDLHPGLTLMDQVQTLAPRMLPAETRDFLARFLFTGDDVFQTVGTLSGGEQSRLALACLVLRGSNLLLLDEPTNHLDLASQEMLQRNLNEFGGTILLVSHDRYLVDAVATQVWEVDPKGKNLVVFPGNYSQYKLEQAKQKPGLQARQPSVRKHQKPLREKSVNRIKVDQLEKEISALELELKDLSAQLENTLHVRGQVAELGRQFVELQQKLDEKLQEWDKILTNQDSGVDNR